MTISYELARELRSAGWDQTYRVGCDYYRKNGELVSISDPSVWDDLGYEEGYRVPSLEELIEAVGEDFMLTNECGRWEAWSNQGAEMIYPVRMGATGANHECEGRTPSEAVAWLWLALNKEKNAETEKKEI